MLSHHNVISAAVLLNEVERRDYQVRQVMLWPMFHAASLIWSHITPLRQGWQTYIPSRFDPSKFLDIVGQFQCTDTGMAPAMMLAVLHIDRPDHEKQRKLSSMRYGVCGSAPVGPELERRWREIIPSNCPWITAYGMTELTGVVSKVHYPMHDNTSSVGALIPNTEAMLFDDEGIEITAYNQPGELFIRGPTVFKGYYKNRVATDECLESGFIRTGDVVYIESESKKLFILDRKKDLIKVRGFQVAPAELESELFSHPGVAEAAVVGITNASGMECPRAYVVRRQGSMPAAFKKLSAMSKSEVQITDTQHVEQVDSMVAEERALVEKRLVQKIDMRLMPMLWLLMVFSYLDRSNLGAANVAGMNKTLNLSDQDYYHAIVTFQVAYVISGTPSNMILVRLRPSLYIPAIMFLWGTCATFLGAVQSREQLWAVRFLLGVTEAGFAPGVMFMFSCWYKREEQAKRFIIFLSASILSGAFGGVLAGAISGHLDGARGIEGWRWLFIIEGVLTVAMALFAPFSLLDYPATSKGLTAEERVVAVERLTTEDITAATDSHENGLSHGRAFVSAVTNWRLYFLALPYMQLVGSSALAYFYPSLIQGLGYTSVKAQYMTAPLYIVALTIAIPTSVAADMFPLQRGFFVFAIMLLGAIFCALATGIRAYVPRYVFLCFINSAIWTGSPIALSYAASNLGPVDPETRAISLGIINGLSQLAQIYGSALFPRSEAPEYLTGFTTYTLLFATGSVIALSGSFLLRKYPYKADF
ncbi:allantoate permease [Fusarium fujikuroi]|nr:allantoate permease [Fusarium fujikuroi]